MYVDTYNENRDVPTALPSDITTPTITIRRPTPTHQPTTSSKQILSSIHMQTTPVVGGGHMKPEDFNNNSLNIDNYIYQRYNESEENILLCWESYAVPLPELVKSTCLYECNMLEYYRLVLNNRFRIQLSKTSKSLFLKI